MPKTFSLDEATGAGGGKTFSLEDALRPAMTPEAFAAEQVAANRPVVKNFTQPAVDAWKTLGKDVGRLSTVKPGGSVADFIPGLGARDKVLGSIVGDLGDLAMSPASGAINGLAVQPGASILDQLPATYLDPKNGFKPMSKAQQHAENEKIVGIGALGLGGEGNILKGGVKPAPLFVDPAGQVGAEAEQAAAAAQRAQATAKAEKKAAQAAKAAAAPITPPEPVTPPTAAPEPAAGPAPPKKRAPRRPTVLGEGDTFSLEEATQPAAPVEHISQVRYRLRQEHDALEADPESAAHPDLPFVLKVAHNPTHYTSEDRRWAADWAGRNGRDDIMRLITDRIRYMSDAAGGDVGLGTSMSAEPEQVARLAKLKAELDADLEHLKGVGQTDIPEELAASSKSMHRGELPLKAIEAPDPLNIEPLEKSVYDLASDFNRALGLTHRQGRITRRSALGTYNTKTGVIRTKAMHELDTLSHEGGHFLEFLQKKAPAGDPITKVLDTHAPILQRIAHRFYGADLSGNPTLARIEGFAEFFRLYVTNPELAAHESGPFYAAFEEVMGRTHPDMLEKLQAIQSHYSAMMTAPSAAVARSVVQMATPPNFFEKIGDALSAKGLKNFSRDLADEAYYGLFDRFHPIKMAVDRLNDILEERTGKRFDLPVHKDPYKLLRMSPAARGAGHMDIRHGVHPYHTLDPEGPALADAVSLALAKPDQVGEWVQAREQMLSGDDAGAPVGHNGGPPLDGEAQAAPTAAPRMPGGRWDKERYHDFSSYLNARNMKAQWERFYRGERELPPDKLPMRVYQQAIKTFETANPHWTHAADMVHTWATNLWKLRHDAGLITRAQYEDGMVNHPDYVPASRVMRDPGDLLDEHGGGFTVGSVGRAGPTGKTAGGVKQMRGSTRDVVDPIWSLAQQAYELRTLIARNDAIGALAEVADKVGAGAGAIMEKVPAKQIKAINFKLLEAIQQAAEVTGLSARDQIEIEQAIETMVDILPEDAAGKIYRATDMNEAGDPIVYHWKKGRRVPYQLADGRLGRMMIESVGTMNRPMRNWFVNMASQPARWLRLGVTLHPKFFLSNIMGDQPTVMSLMRGYVPYLDWARGLKEEIKGGDVSRRYNASMGAVGGMQTAAEREVMAHRNVKALLDKGFDIRELPQKLAAVSEISETGTRLGAYMKATKAAEKKGAAPYAASMEGSYAARDILDFDRRGAWSVVQAFTRIVPFMNANIQAVDKARRVAFTPVAFRMLMGERPRTPGEAEEMKSALHLWMSMVGMAMGGLALRAAFADDPEYQEVADYLRATHWVFKVPGTDGEYFVMKKPYEMGALSDFVERMYEAIVLGDPTAMGQGLKDVAGLLIPGVIAPPVLQIPFQLAGNKDNFGQPIVPENLKGKVEPRDEETEYTSTVAKAIGHGLNWSPAQIDFVMKSMSGHWGGDVLKGIDSATTSRPEIEQNMPDMFVVSRFVRDVTRGNVSSKNFWGSIEDLGKKEGSVRLRIMAGDDDDAYKALKAMKPEERSYVMMSLFGHGKEKEVHPMVRAQKAYVAISGLAKDLQTGEVRATPHGRPVEITPKQRRDAVDALHYMNMAQLHNALKDVGFKGYEHAKPLDETAALAKLYHASPGLYQAFQERMMAAQVMPLADQKRVWAAVRSRYEELPPEAQFDRMTQVKREAGRGGVMRSLRAPAQPN